MFTIVTYEIRKIKEDGTDVSYFSGTNFEVMSELWSKHRKESGCYFVIKIPNDIDR